MEISQLLKKWEQEGLQFTLTGGELAVTGASEVIDSASSELKPRKPEIVEYLSSTAIRTPTGWKSPEGVTGLRALAVVLAAMKEEKG